MRRPTAVSRTLPRSKPISLVRMENLACSSINALRTVWTSPLQDPEWRSAAFGPTAELQVRLLASYPATPVAVEVVAPSLLPSVLAAVEGGFATEAAALAATQRPDALRCLLRFVDNHIGRLASEAVSVCARGV